MYCMARVPPSGDAFITELTKYQSKSGAAGKELMRNMKSRFIDEKAGLAAFKRVSQKV
jgi:hypothetical protein